MTDRVVPPRLQAHGIGKSFAGVEVLRDVSFEVQGGEVLAVVGENGSGKSTTMNILAGLIAADSGRLYLDGQIYAPSSRHASQSAGIAFVQQELNIFPNLTVAENLLLSRFPRAHERLPLISKKRMHERAAELLHAVNLHVRPSLLASELSAGERQLLEIARGLSADAKVLILDEPTTSLSTPEIERLFDLVEGLRRRAAAIIFVSHSLSDVLRVSDRVLVLRDGQITLRAKRGEVDVNGLIAAMIGRSMQQLFPPRAAKRASGACVLRVENVAEPGVLTDVSFEVARGEIVGIAGLMGAGRSELARILFGLDPYRDGVISANGRRLPPAKVSAALAAGVAFLTEDRRQDGLMLESTVEENLAIAVLPLLATAVLGRLHFRALRARVAAVAERLRIKCKDIERARVATLSGGHQQKVILGRWLLRKPSIFILDEPTRGVDIGAKGEIYQLLVEVADQGMALIVISSDLAELTGLCDRILVLHQGRVQGSFERAQFSHERILRAAFGGRVAS